MKIDLSPPPLDKEGGTRSSPKGDKALGALRDAFDKAVRDAAPKTQVKNGAKAVGDESEDDHAPADAKETSTGESVENAPPDGEPSSEEAGSAAAANAKSLQSLLGLLGGVDQAVGRPAAAAVEADTGKATGDVQPPKIADLEGQRLDGLAAQARDADGASTDPVKRAVRLDVLRMETHFEPRQDGMVLIDPLEAKAVSGDAEAATLVDLPAKKSEGAVSSATHSDEPGEGIRLRFDEAVARLGRSGGEGSGGKGASRDGSASSQGAIVDLADRRSAARSLDSASATGGSTVTTATSSSPTTALGLAGQVAGPIMEALGDSRAYAAPAFAPPGDTHLKMRAGGAALKTLTIQLHPEQLGTLDVSMRLVEGKLAIELSASQSDTAALLLEDRASLRKLLEHAGFSLDDAAITVVTRDAAAPKSAATSDTGADPRGTSGGSQGDGEAGRRSSDHAGGNETDRRQQRRAASEEPRKAQTRSGSTYL